MQTNDTSVLIGRQWVELPYPVEKTLSYQNLVIVMVTPPPKIKFNRNVLAFNESAEQVWQIEESPHGTESDKPYVGIFIGEDGALIASNWNGVDYRVAPESGGLTVQNFRK